MNLTSAMNANVASKAEEDTDVSAFVSSQTTEKIEITEDTPDYDLTQMALNAAMRVHTPHSYRCSVLLDGASPLAIARGWRR